MNQLTSYRDSHKKKGADYHAAFDELPHRKMVWQIEQKVLMKIVQKNLG